MNGALGGRLVVLAPLVLGASACAQDWLEGTVLVSLESTDFIDCPSEPDRDLLAWDGDFPCPVRVNVRGPYTRVSRSSYFNNWGDMVCAYEAEYRRIDAPSCE